MQKFVRKKIKAGMLGVFLVAVMLNLGGAMAYAACGTDPTVSFDLTAQNVQPGASVDYTVTITNNDAGSCDFDLSTADNDVNFSSSLPDGTPFTVAGGATASLTLTVAAAGTAPIGATNTTTLSVGGATVVDYTVNTTANNPLLHNSFNLNSSKWSADGGWGLPGTKYGEFTCFTCHQRGSSNIKRIVTEIPDTIGEPVVKPVNFQATSGADSFGNDGDNHSASTRVCEVCHTATSVHKYDISGGLADTNHQNANDADCISCHAHSQGFGASCTSCHGDDATGEFWPDSDPDNLYPDRFGAHDTHVNKIGNYLASGDKDNAASTTTAHRNNTCDYCHPDPGGANADGGPHSSDTSGSAVDTADIHQDGFNAGTNFKYLDGSPDDGYYNPTIKRCSNIDCHSNGLFTWPWYGDVIPPAAIDDLAAASGDDPGTVQLTWSAPGNDGDTAGKSYQYEVRYSTAPIGDDTDWLAAIIAGGPPTTKWPGSGQSMVVEGLTPGTTYYFAIKTGDEAGNWSAVSSPNPSATAAPDTDAPLFRGLETALPAFTSGVVNLTWPEANDFSEPITYEIWWAETSTSIDYAQPASATTTGLTFQVTGLTNGINYNFSVRARDAAGNIDSNVVQKEAIPQAPAEMSWDGKFYYATPTGISACDNDVTGGTHTGELSATGYTCLTDDRTRIRDFASGDTALWRLPTNYAETINIQGGRFTINVEEQNEAPAELRVRLGYWDGGAFVELGNVTEIVPANSRGGINFGLASISGQIPAGNAIAVKLERVSGLLDLRYGSDRYASFLSVFEQVQNDRPAPFTVNEPVADSLQSGDVTVSWNAATDPDGDAVTYDIYGSIDNGSSYPYIIAEDLSVTSVSWDTLTAGIGLAAQVDTVQVKVAASDGLNHNEGGVFYDSREAFSGIFKVNNSADVTPPAAITDLVAEHRPKAGSVYLYWSAPGDDGLEGRAAQYDIRYSDSLIDAGSFSSSPAVVGEPVPGEPGKRQGYEVLGLTPGMTYYFAIKTADEVPNWSTISNVPNSTGGPRCGVCHSTPPDQAARAGTHEEHGFTQIDCSKCHGAEASSFGNSHSDGANKVAFNNPNQGYINTAYPPVTETADQVTYHDGGTGAGVVIYDDTTGGGGYNDIEPGGDNIDNGSCFNFNTTGVTGCHGAAGTDPDGAGPLPTYPAPKWGDRTSVSCAMCHGDQSRPNATPYERPFEDGTRDTKYAGNVEIFKAAPGIDLLGNTDSNAVGQHLRHLNFSYRFTGDSCALCHMGNQHADGTVDVVLDPSVAGADAVWTPEAGGPGTPGTCGGTSGIRCHGNNTTDPEWKVRSPEPDGPRIVECNECHGFQGLTYNVGGTTSADTQIPHVWDNGQVRHCTHCHVEGHPREGYSISAISNANPAQVTSANHGLTTGDWAVLHVDGIEELDHFFASVTVVDADNYTLDGVDSTSFGTFEKGYWKRSYAAKTITAITNANPAVVTSAGHGLTTGDNVLLDVTGMIELDTYHGPATVIDVDTFSLDGVDSSGYGAFSSGRWIPDDGAITVPNYSIGGIDYSSGGIHLKRVVNGRTNLNNGELIETEAETCWGCHEDQSPVISEWGTNNKALTGSSPYDYGTLDKSSWIGATWSSANFSYKDGTIASTHSVNPDVTSPGLDNAEDIRCSYCHDVHDMNKAIGDNVSGTPFLRGTWLGNPYQEDGAPGRNDRGAVQFPVGGTIGDKITYYPKEVDYGAVPRGSALDSKMGGYWIDQNSGYPTATWSLSGSAGLCTMCHGTDIEAMNKFGDASVDWVGTNGHSNAAIGGTGTVKANIYNPANRQEGGADGVTAWDEPGMGYQSTPMQSTEEMWGLRHNDRNDFTPSGTLATSAQSEAGVFPYIWNTEFNRPEMAFGKFSWGVDRSTTDPEVGYHRFSCSKCHNPHASRLPRLMITNCLDVRHNKWDDVFADDGDWTQSDGSPPGQLDRDWANSSAMPYNGTDSWNSKDYDKQYAYATTAQNCHRYVDINGDGTPEEAGWNRVTPWRE